VVEALSYKPEGCGIVSLEFFVDIIFPPMSAPVAWLQGPTYHGKTGRKILCWIFHKLDRRA
jgi:hypothetical protein